MLEVIIAVAAAILLGNVLAHRLGVPPAILLIFLGLALALAPVHQLNDVRELGLPPHVILEIFLPVMLFWETRNTSWREVRTRLRGILLTGTALVVFTAFAVAWVLHSFVGVYSWPVALIIGAALAPTDAVAVATLNGKLPKSAITTLKAEALINDGTTLVLFALALQLAGGRSLSAAHASGMFLFSFLIGALVGLAVGWAANALRAYIKSPMNFSVFMFTVPFAAFLISESIEPFRDMKGSGVVAVVVAAFYLTYRGPDTIKPVNRFYGLPIWSFVSYLMNGALFVLVGVQLPSAVKRMGETIERFDSSWGYGLKVVAAAWAVSVLARFVFVHVVIGIIRALDRSERQRRLRTTFRGRVVSTFAGLRGGVSLAVALSVPSGTFGRDFTIFVVGGVVMLSMVVQGLLLPAVIRWAKIPPDTSEKEEIHYAMNAISREGYEALDDIAARVGASQEAIDGAKAEWSRFQKGLEEEANARNNPDLDDSQSYWRQNRALRLAAIDYQREALKRLRNEGKIDMNVLHAVQERLDVEEIRVIGPVELD